MNDYVIRLVHSRCVGLKTFETSIPSRVNFAVPITLMVSTYDEAVSKSALARGARAHFFY